YLMQPAPLEYGAQHPEVLDLALGPAGSRRAEPVSEADEVAGFALAPTAGLEAPHHRPGGLLRRRRRRGRRRLGACDGLETAVRTPRGAGASGPMGQLVGGPRPVEDRHGPNLVA